MTPPTLSIHQHYQALNAESTGGQCSPSVHTFGTLMEGIASGYEDVKTPDLP